ncbi:protein kinase domain-containing protein [Kitasatospora purpeofusca]|uniref:protein kinase domain-containing protein n=1 Tax=Kitasatospora purpeofusca TaxID=67352 RepID=UPI003F4A93E6
MPRPTPTLEAAAPPPPGREPPRLQKNGQRKNRRSPRRCPHGRSPQDLLATGIAGHTPLDLLRDRGCQNVFRALAPGGDRVALKTTCLDAAPSSLARARNEARGLRQAAAHPLVADLTGEGVHDGLHYLAVAWQPGLTLHQLLDHLDRSMSAWSPGSAEFLTHLALTLCHALDGLHHHGVVHADLSPRNIILGHGRTLTLIDLDSCVHSADPDPGALDRCATTLYAAPECLDSRSGHVPTTASDQYSTAAILYRVLQQRHHVPRTDSRRKTREHQLDHPPRPLTGWPAATWPRLPDVLHRALHPAPAHRHPSTGHFTTHLRNALALTGARP